MNSEFIKQCGNSSELCYFLFKNYGLELLFLLEQFEASSEDNGIDDTYDAIQFFKPRRAAFRAYCGFLRDKNAIVYSGSCFKQSKIVLRLSIVAVSQLKEARKTPPLTY